MYLKISRIKDKAMRFLSTLTPTKLVVIAGIAGILLIMFSQLIPDTPDAESSSDIGYDILSDDGDLYKKQVESELMKMIGQIEGVGELEVMVTISATTEYVYAQELDTDNDKDGERTNEKYKSKIVMSEKDGERQALVRKMIRPPISGVMIVCQGGGTPTVKERVINAAATALDLPSGRICVERMES